MVWKISCSAEQTFLPLFLSEEVEKLSLDGADEEGEGGGGWLEVGVSMLVGLV